MEAVVLSVLLASALGQPNYGGCNIFPANMAWNVKIDGLPVHPQNAQFAATLGTTKLHLDLGTTTDQTSSSFYGIPWNQVLGTNPWVPITFDNNGGYHDESDCATGDAPPYTINSPCGACGSPALTNVKLPIPSNALVESGTVPVPDGNDHHLLLLDTANCSLWEVYQTYKNASGWFTPGGIARWDLTTGKLRPKGWTSSDAAGLPVMPLLLRTNEATGPGSIQHAFRFTLNKAQIRSGTTVYEWPASHNTGGGGTSTPMMGQRWRLKASFSIPSTWSAQAKSIATALQEYGIILADIGSPMFIQGEPNAGWSDTMISQIQTISASDFEAVDIASWKSLTGFNAASGLVPTASPAQDPCLNFSCSGNGVCTNGVCSCTGAWTGLHCDVVANCPSNAGWPSTAPGVTAVLACPVNQTGNNTRVCTTQGVWGIQINTCVARPTCSDGVQNQDETAVDCGGSVCSACAQCPTINCGSNGMCVEANPPTCTCSGGFTGDRCQTPPNPCLTLNCGTHGTCNSATGLCVCTGNYTGQLCQFAPQTTCADGIQNQNETGVDCGGPCPACKVYTWVALGWEACSVSCGGGQQTRTVQCTDTSTSPGGVVSQTLCDGLHTTPSVQVCNQDACPTYTWRAGQFGPCTAPCGTGNQTRPVDCISSAGNVVVPAGPSTCPLDSSQPALVQICNTDPCSSNHWVAGTWFPCTRSCGGGTESRAMTCFNPTDTMALADDQCTAVKPVTQQACNLQECKTYHWEACKHWSPCSATCNGAAGMLGQQWRDVFCLDNLGNYVDSTLCNNDTKPIAVVNVCNTQACITYNWMTNAPGWGPCVDGYRNRSFHCHAADASNSLIQFCQQFAGPQPIDTIPCTPGTCLVADCPDAEINNFFAVCKITDFNLLGDTVTPTRCSPECAAAYAQMSKAFVKPPYTDNTQQLCIESFLGAPNFGVNVEVAALLARRNLLCVTISGAATSVYWMALLLSVFGALFNV